jgi:NADH-quinone oxidoreductase subunit L
MIVNRIGDLGLVIGICLLFLLSKTVDYATVFALAPNIAKQNTSFLMLDVNGLTFVTLFLFFGAVGKSAQIGLHI